MRILLVLTLYFLYNMNLFAQNWSNFTNFSNVFSITSSTSKIVAGTSGGVIVYDTNGKIINQYTSKDGLLGNSVETVVIDKNEDIYVGQENGLVVIRGNTVLRCDFDSHYVTSLAVDKNNNIWMAVWCEDLYMYDHSTFTNFRVTGTTKYIGDVRKILIDRREYVWMATNSGLVVTNKNSWHFFDTETSTIPSDNIYDIAFDSNENIWLATDNGVSFFNMDSFVNYNKSNSQLLDNHVTAVEMGNNGDLWVANWKGINIIQDSVWMSFKSTDLQIGNPEDLIISEESDKYIVSDNNIYFQDKDSNWKEFEVNTNSILGNNVTCMAIDKNGDKLVFSNGLQKFDDSLWTNINLGKDANKSIFNLSFAHNGNLLICYGIKLGNYILTGYGAGIYDGSKTTIYTPANSGLIDYIIVEICSDSKNNLWFASPEKGICMYDGTQWITYDTTNSGIASNCITGIMCDNADNIIIATLSKGISRFDGINWTTYLSSNSGLIDNKIVKLKKDSSGNVWACSRKALSVFKDEEWKSTTMFNDYYSWKTSDFSIDMKGNIWVGTPGDGMAKYDGEKWTKYGVWESGLASNNINSIFTDFNGYTWFGTRNGLCSIFSGLPVQSIQETRAKNGITIVSNKILIDHDYYQNGFDLMIYDLNGKMIKIIQNCHESEIQIDLEHGLYIFAITSMRKKEAVKALIL